MKSIGDNKQFCRLCLAEENKLISVFRKNEDVHKYIYSFFAVEIKKDDPYSTQVCELCLDFIISIIKKRLEYRENDRRLKETIKIVPKPTPERQYTGPNTQKYKKKVHGSVVKIFKENKKILIPEHFWVYNFDGYVNPNMVPKPWPRYNREKLSKPGPKKRGRKKEMIDPPFTGNITKNVKDKEKSDIGFSEQMKMDLEVSKIDTESDTESITSSSLSSHDIANDVKTNRRIPKSIERFGSPICYGQSGMDALDAIMSEETQCESYYIYNVNHKRPTDFSLLNNCDNSNKTNSLSNSINFKTNNKSVFLNNFGVKKYKFNCNIKSKFKSKNVDKTFQDYIPNVSYKPVQCSEDNWNRFFNNHYEKPEQVNVNFDSIDDENHTLPLLLMTGPEKRVYLCHYCEKVFYNGRSRKKHILNTHQFNPVLGICGNFIT